MSDDADHVAGADERRVSDALAAHGAQVRPDPGAGDRIDARLDERGASGSAGDRRPLLVAAAVVVLIVLTGAVVLRARSTDAEVQVATASEAGELAIVAVDDGGQLVELDPSGTEQRVVYQPGATSSGANAPLLGPISVSPADRTIYAERVTADLCGSSADSRQYGEVVAISFDDGSTTVAVPVGAHPAVSTGGDRLAYLTSPDGTRCTSSWAPVVVEVVDLRTGARSSYRPTAPPVGELSSGYDGPTGTDLPTPGAAAVLDLAWDAEGSLLVLVGAARSSDASVERVSFGADLAVSSVESSPNVGGVRPSRPASDDPGLYTDTFAPMSAGRVAVGGRVHDEVGTQVGATTVYGGAVEVYDVALQLIATGPVGTSIDLHVSSEQLGLTPILVGGLSIDELTGRLLLLVHGRPGGGARETATAASPDVAPTELSDGRVTTSSRLLQWDGSSLSELGSAFRSAAWIRVSRGPVPPPPTTHGTSTSTSIAVVPPGPGLPAVTGPGPDLAAPSLGEERPDDAAAIADAFRSFFQQGDHSALEGSGVLGPAMDEGAKTVNDGGKGVTVTIDAIIFRSEAEAEVRFRLDQNGNYFTAATNGSAVYVDGRWKVSAATMCTLLSRVNIACPTDP